MRELETILNIVEETGQGWLLQGLTAVITIGLIIKTSSLALLKLFESFKQIQQLDKKQVDITVMNSKNIEKNQQQISKLEGEVFSVKERVARVEGRTEK